MPAEGACRVLLQLCQEQQLPEQLGTAPGSLSSQTPFAFALKAFQELLLAAASSVFSGTYKLFLV